MKNCYYIIGLFLLLSCGGGGESDEGPTGPLQITTTVGVKNEWDATIQGGSYGSGTNVDKLAGMEIDLSKDVLYGYAQLSADEKKVYDYLWKIAQNYGAAGTGPYREIIYCEDEELKISQMALSKVLNYFKSDCPFFFNMGAISAYVNGEYLSQLTVNYFLQRLSFNSQYQAVLTNADKILNTLPSGLSEYDRALYLHNEFLSIVSYGMESGYEGSLFGAFALRKVVCEGYAHAYQYLLQRAGIQALYVAGRAGTGKDEVAHAWNIVRINGKYYLADPTWDDSQIGYSTKFFLKSSATLSDHRPDARYNLPECNEDYKK